MTLARRFLPSMSLLRAFEAAARHQSFTASAAELSLTQGAISKQIRALEEITGAELFIRDRQTVRLTLAGAAYAREVRAALRHIANATLEFRANPGGGTLNLAILPTFGARWLANKLPSFIASCPGVTLNMITRLAPFDFAADQLDAAIHFGEPDWPGAELDLLMTETVVLVCSPAMAIKYMFVEPADVLAAPLLHLVTRPDAWERWFEANHVEPASLHGMLVDQFAVAIQAAVAGVGVALTPKFMIEAELARGDLVQAVDSSIESKGRYYLAWPLDRGSHGPLQAFRTWIRRVISIP